MDVKEDKKQEEYNDQKDLKNKGTKKLKDKVKKAIIKKIIAMIAAKAMIGTIIASVLGVLLFFASSDFLVSADTEKRINNAKAQAITTTYSANAATTETDENGNTTNKIVVTTNQTGNGYEIKYNNDPEYIKGLRAQLATDGVIESADNFTDFQIAVIGSLVDAGANLDFYNDEQLKCFATFIKAEASTKNLDLRPNSEKYDSNDNYIPQKIEDLAENEVPGVISVERTNTNGTVTKLEYKTEEIFNGLFEAKDPQIINYFTINENGELVFAKWEYIKVDVNEEEYPESVSEGEREIDRDEYIYVRQQIPYSQLVVEYTMPFEFLNQLLIITEESDFCMDLVNYVFDSKIVINIQEEETITNTIEERKYHIYNKEEHRIDYTIDTDTIVEKELLVGKDSNGEKLVDDEGNECTTFKHDEKTVTITTSRKEHTYKWGISEVDTWNVKVLNRYDYTNATPQEEVYPKETLQPIINEYQIGEIKEFTNSSEIFGDEHVKAFDEENSDKNIIINVLRITPYSKMNIDSSISKTLTKWPAQTPIPSKHYYTKDIDGNLEKFLIAYDNNKDAQDAFNSIDSWLYGMMEKNTATAKLESYIKYALSVYDGVDRGVTEEQIGLFEEKEFITIGSSTGTVTGWRWPIGSEDVTAVVDGKKFASGTPALGESSISRAGLPGSAYNGYYGTHPKPEDNPTGAAVDIGAGGKSGYYYVVSIGKGVVTKVENGNIPDGQKTPAVGNCVTVDYDGLEVRYMHLYAGSIEVTVGDTVDYGQVIGKIGNSGDSTGAHLHIDMKKDGVFVDATEYINPNSTGTMAQGSEIIIEKCIEVMNDMIEHQVRYKANDAELIYCDIETASDFNRPNPRVCCSTYVGIVLYRAGIFTPEFMNKYDYNSPLKLNNMLEAAGWILVSPEEAKQGDVCNWKSADDEHSFIYAGGNETWDQRSGCISTNGEAPCEGSRSNWDYFLKTAIDLKIWRMPS